jgi:hypothetical protein
VVLVGARADGTACWPYPGAVADNTRVPLNRTERIIAFAVASVGGISIIAIVAVFIGRAANADFTNGAWPAVATLPLIGLPLTLVALLVFMIMTTVRRNRLARDAGE